MAATEAWRDITHTGPGTLAGQYLRLFWQPIYRAQDLPAGRAIPIRIMSEDYTLYRGESGQVYLVDADCAHRGTQLIGRLGRARTIRCRYHGWMYDGSGQCVEQPLEDRPFCERVRIRSYPTQEYLGLIFAYLGEGEPPPIAPARCGSAGYVEAGAARVLALQLHDPYRQRLPPRGVHPYGVGDPHGRADALRSPNLESEETEYGVRTFAPAKPGTVAALHRLPHAEHQPGSQPSHRGHARGRAKPGGRPLLLARAGRRRQLHQLRRGCWS